MCFVQIFLSKIYYFITTYILDVLFCKNLFIIYVNIRIYAFCFMCKWYILIQLKSYIIYHYTVIKVI